MLKITNTEKAPAAIGPYSQAVSVGNVLFASGQVPLLPGSGEVVGTTIEEQADRACKNVQAILEANGLTFGNVVKTTATSSPPWTPKPSAAPWWIVVTNGTPCWKPCRYTVSMARSIGFLLRRWLQRLWIDYKRTELRFR